MGTASRIGGRDTEHVPGPGNYNVSKNIGEGPKYSMKGRHEMKNNEFTPGPGQYDSSKNPHLVHNPTWK